MGVRSRNPEDTLDTHEYTYNITERNSPACTKARPPAVYHCREEREFVRKLFPQGKLVEVCVRVSLEEAERRDPKGLYKKARAGEIRGFTGVDGAGVGD